MKFSTPLVLAAVVGSASAFTVGSQPKSFASQTSLNAEQSRKDFLAQAVAIASSVAAFSQPAVAASYGGFGSSGSAVIDPKDVEIDDEIMASSAVQNSIQKLKDCKAAVKKMQSTLESDPQANVKPIIVKELESSSLREALNTFGTAFEEDTQRATDRLTRVLLQDITELEIANNQKEGIPRSPRRLETMKGKLAKLEKAFDDYLAYAK